MKQLIEDIANGESRVVDVPVPRPDSRQVLVQVVRSLVSAGTERMVINFAEKNLAAKARARPDLVRQTLDKAQRDGILSTIKAVQNRLSQPMALGYSCAGTIVEIGEEVSGLHLGDRVACAGGGYASHAEYVAVPQTLIASVSDEVDFESAAFTTLGAIALQGIRLADVRLGEIAAVIGLGLLGQLTVQMLKASGCRVLGMDIRPDRENLAHQMGIEFATTSADELNSISHQLTTGNGVDAVLITADTQSNQPVELAGEIARKKGIVVAVGAVGMNIPRKVYYHKELDFKISSSYGPGRYDPLYEEKGIDYPYAFVRWTENRNMQAFVQMLAEGTVNVGPLISHRFPIERSAEAYELISGKADPDYMGILLTYPDKPQRAFSDERKITLRPRPAAADTKKEGEIATIGLGMLGSGNYANATLLPIIKKSADIALVGIASRSGKSARITGDRFGFDYCTTDGDRIMDDERVNTVAILTRHNLHAKQVIAALMAGKHVFVEKPLCLSDNELQAILSAYEAARVEHGALKFLVGYNRRFAPFVQELKKQLEQIHEPLVLNYRVNAGYIPPDHWTQDPEQGGGRLRGEGCHFIDLLIFLADSQLTSIATTALPDSERYSQDNFVVMLIFSNGSVGTITYVANGDKAYSKELLEVFGGGLAARIDDYRSLQIHHGKNRVKRKARLRQDKGHLSEWRAWTAHLSDQGPPPITMSEIVTSTEATLAADQSRKRGLSINFELG